MTLNELKSLCLEKLSDNFLKEEILAFYYLLVEHISHLKKPDVYLNPNLKISTVDVTHFKRAIQSLKEEKPIQYITGSTDFFGLTFKVNSDVLIPRPETEELVEWILKDHKHEMLDAKPKTLLDIGTGSGCIAISLAKNLANTNVSALDISKNALKVAQFNAEQNNVNIDFIEHDILTFYSLKNTLKYDIVVSNPPYVRQLEKQEMKNNVLQNEPHLALFVENNNPLLFYNAISDFANEHLIKNGKIYFEINQYLASETVTLLEQKGFHSIELREDLFGNKRMLKAVKK